MGIVAGASDLYAHKDLVKLLAIRDLRLRYERSVLGFLWTILNPLVMIAVYTFVFSSVLKSGIKLFPMFLVPVMLPWNFMVKCLTGVSPLLYQSGSLVSRSSFPSEAIIFGGMLSNFVEFCLEISIFMVISHFIGFPLFPFILMVPVAMLLLFLFTAGLVLILSVGQVYYRDTQYIISLLSMAWFFMTPVFYAPTSIPERFLWIYNTNPMVHIAACFRDPLYYCIFPPASTIETAAAVAVCFFVTGWLFYDKHRRELPELV